MFREAPMKMFTSTMFVLQHPATAPSVADAPDDAMVIA